MENSGAQVDLHPYEDNGDLSDRNSSRSSILWTDLHRTTYCSKLTFETT